MNSYLNLIRIPGAAVTIATECAKFRQFFLHIKTLNTLTLRNSNLRLLRDILGDYLVLL